MHASEMGEESEKPFDTCHLCNEKAVIYESSLSSVIWGAGSNGDATKLGHIVVIPKRHVDQISELRSDELLDLVRACYNGLRAVYASWYTASSWGKAGVADKGSANLGFNYGPDSHDPIAAGCGHLAIHVVSRNPNDTNFMWWTTRSSILHLKDKPMEEAFMNYMKLLENQERCETRSPQIEAFTSIPNFDFTEPAPDNCPLCKETDEIHENKTARVLFSVKPYKFGHVMVIPKRHVALLDSFAASELVDIASLIDESIKALKSALGLSSFSIGVNHGPHSGASIPSHLHIHIVPRDLLDGSSGYWEDMERKYGSLEKPQIVRDKFLEFFGGKTGK